MGKWKTILVGVDGSPSSRKALTWAAAEAGDHGADLVVLNVWEHSLLAPLGSGSVPEGKVPDASKNAAEVLIEESTGADLLVVGTRGHGGFTGLVLGSVSQHVAADAKCPVAVIR